MSAPTNTSPLTIDPSRVRGRRGPLRYLAALATRYSAPYESALAVRKRALFAGLRGRVVEIGPGGGVNLPFLRADGTRQLEWVGVEPSLSMQVELRARAASLGVGGRLVTGIAEALPLEDASADAVVATLVLCSVDDVSATLAEVRRVLRPGGRFVFVEHVAAPVGTRLRCKQQLLSPLWGFLGDGCRPAQDTASFLTSAGFSSLRLERFDVPAGLLSPHIAGIAIR